MAADIENAFGVEARISTDVPGYVQESARRRGQPVPEWWLQFTVDAMRIDAGFEVADPTLPPACTAKQLARMVQDDVLSGTGTAWPADPSNPGHPLVPADDGWRSTADPDVLVAYGTVDRAQARRPCPDGTVRWWLDEQSFGVIASDDGDVWFSHLNLVPGPDGHRPEIREGTRVEYTVREGKHGVFRPADEVTLTTR